MDCGFCSFEADIHLVGGKLLVAHSRAAVKPDRTLQSLYLDPMKKRIGENGGQLYRNGPPVWLLIDFKGDPKTTYPVLRQILEQYADLFTIWRDGKKTQGAITAVLTGNHPDESVLAAENVRYATIDGILESRLFRNPPARSGSMDEQPVGPELSMARDRRISRGGAAKIAARLVEKAHSQGPVDSVLGRTR